MCKFMWEEDPLCPMDVTVLNKDYLVAEGRASLFSQGEDRLGENAQNPIFYLLKVHEGYPIRISCSHPSSLHIWPAGEETRMPAEVERDEKAHDLTGFVLIPRAIELEERYRRVWDLTPVPDSFIHADGRIGAASLLQTIKPGLGVAQQGVHKFSFVPSSQVINHLYRWLVDEKYTISYGLASGKISISYERGRNLVRDIGKRLEERYKERFLFPCIGER